ncbi:MAG: UDP-N-acetylglucosamine 1-carboxyvinyltransferase [Planctomycetota bacterium]|jgi:UDP-N-acetylglucosamine 1-carboxyvinyltransferase
MDRIVIEGGVPPMGSVPVSGAKNAALPILAATLLMEGECRLEGIPNLRDIRTLTRLLEELGSTVERNADGSVSVAVTDPERIEAPYRIVKEMRASFCVLGPLLARRGSARVSMPGGCNIGLRPVDLHLKGLRALGARLEFDGGYVEGSGPLKGDEVFLAGAFGSTVLGTANVMMAATLAEGRTVIEGAACEPEIADLARFLVACGARIEGIGSHRLVIDGVDRLVGTSWRVIPDRMEAGTFMAAAAITGGEVFCEGVDAASLGAVLEALKGLGAAVERSPEGIRVRGPERPRPLDMTTLPYPGFPTDLQAPFSAVLAKADGMSVITEKIYPERFMHVAELNRMGAVIRKQGPSAILQGVERLTGAEVMASDIRGGAALVVAALAARGTTTIHRVYHIDRGYEGIERKLSALGCKASRESEPATG